jgi:hypothetical protein
LLVGTGEAPDKNAAVSSAGGVHDVKTQYTPNVDAVLYGRDVARFTPADWCTLALAALDQAGVSPATLAEAYRRARGSIMATVVNIDFDEVPMKRD